MSVHMCVHVCCRLASQYNTLLWQPSMQQYNAYAVGSIRTGNPGTEATAAYIQVRQAWAGRLQALRLHCERSGCSGSYCQLHCIVQALVLSHASSTEHHRGMTCV